MSPLVNVRQWRQPWSPAQPSPPVQPSAVHSVVNRKKPTPAPRFGFASAKHASLQPPPDGSAPPPSGGGGDGGGGSSTSADPLGMHGAQSSAHSVATVVFAAASSAPWPLSHSILAPQLYTPLWSHGVSHTSSQPSSAAGVDGDGAVNGGSGGGGGASGDALNG